MTDLYVDPKFLKTLQRLKQFKQLWLLIYNIYIFSWQYEVCSSDAKTCKCQVKNPSKISIFPMFMFYFFKGKENNVLVFCHKSEILNLHTCKRLKKLLILEEHFRAFCIWTLHVQKSEQCGIKKIIDLHFITLTLFQTNHLFIIWIQIRLFF